MVYEEENEKLIKYTAKKFLGDEELVHKQFDSDTHKPPIPYAAPPTLWDILAILHQNSQLIYAVFSNIIITAIAYHLGRRAAKNDREQIITKIREILREKQEPIKKQVKANRKLQSKLRWSIRWQLQADKEWKQKWEIRLKVYTEKAEILLDIEKAATIIMQIIDEINETNSDGGND